MDEIETSHVFEFLNDNYFKDSQKKLFALEGSSGAAKTWGGIDFILEYCRVNSYENKRLTIGRETYKDCIDTIAFDFIKRLKQIGWYNEKCHSKSHPQKYFLFGNEIDFTGWSNNGQPSKRQDGLWFNEILESGEEVFKQYNQRTNDFVLFDWNPKVTFHWVYTALLNRPDCYYKKCLMLDNPFLPEGQRNELLAYEPTAENIKNGTADDFMYKVYVLGERADAKGLIFQNIDWITEFPKDIRYQWGLDFGFTNDPTALTKVGVSSEGLFIELLCYEPIDHATSIDEMLTNAGVKKGDRIIGDSADKYNDQEMVKDLRNLGWNIFKANKSNGIKWGIGQIKKNKIHIVSNINAKREAENYKWREINGICINEPIDKFNHMWDSCFSGNTPVSTPIGNIHIDQLKVNDYVFTSNGVNKIIEFHNNGIKQIYKYSIQLDTFCIFLCCTSDHLIKTTQGWIKIKDLNSGMKIYQFNGLTGKNIDYIQGSGIFQEATKECILPYGSFITGILTKNQPFTIKMKTHGITLLKILKNWIRKFIVQIILKKDLRKIKHGLKTLFLKASKVQKHGINQRMGKNGTLNMVKNAGKVENTNYLHALNAGKSLNQGMQEQLNTVIKTVKHVQIEEIGKQNVYDLTIENNHEYFANGILVHNCRYAYIDMSNSMVPIIW